jgi:hypothetical protein
MTPKDWRKLAAVPDDEFETALSDPTTMPKDKFEAAVELAGPADEAVPTE